MNHQYLKDYEIHIVFSPGVDTQEIQFLLASLLKNHHFFISWSQGDYFQHLSQSALVVGFAGTAIEQAAFLGIPLLNLGKKMPFKSIGILLKTDKNFSFGKH